MSSVKKIVKALRSEGLLRQKALALGIGLDIVTSSMSAIVGME